MGSVILQQVLTALKNGGFAAELAYPGRKMPQITGPVAAVHMARVDSAALTSTVSVTILSPGELGGAACEAEALKALELLLGCGAVCVLEGCVYDRVSQLYAVEISATFTSLAQSEEEETPAGPGFSVSINGIRHGCAVAFQSEEARGYTTEYVTTEPLPVASGTGMVQWSLRLEEQIPVGTAEPAEPSPGFSLVVTTDEKKEVYTGCQWTSVSREYSSQGLRRLRKGFALKREETANG